MTVGPCVIGVAAGWTGFALGLWKEAGTTPMTRKGSERDTAGRAGFAALTAVATTITCRRGRRAAVRPELRIATPASAHAYHHFRTEDLTFSTGKACRPYQRAGGIT